MRSYDSSGDLVGTTDALGATTAETADSSGDVTSIRDPLGNVASFSYDEAGNVTGETDIDGTTISYTYDAEGNEIGSVQTSTRPAQSVVTTSVYDADGRLVESTSPTGTTFTAYNALGDAVSTTDELGGITTQDFDARGDLVQSTSPDGEITSTVYDADGHAIWSVDAHLPGRPADGTRDYYDALGRVVRTERYSDVVINVSQQLDGTWTSAFVSSGPTPLSITTTVYNGAGNVIQVTDATGHVVSYKYDADGHQIEVDDVVNGQPRSTQTAYDAAGIVSRTIDALGRITQYQYDADGNLLTTTYADGSTTSAAYDQEGRQISSTDQLGNTTNYQYDPQGNLTAVLLAAVVDPSTGNTVRPEYQYTYDQYGDELSSTDPLGDETTFGFDALGNQVSETLPAVSGQAGATETYTYNSLGQLATSTDFDGQITTYAYDDLGRVTSKKYYASLSDYQAGTIADQTTYAYDIVEADGVHDTVTDSTGTTDTLYDAEGRVIKVTSPEGTINYAFDPATGEEIDTWTNNSDIEYGYDQEGRLTTVTVVEQNGVLLATPEVTTYSYDLDNNLISTVLPNGVTTAYTYDDLNGCSCAIPSEMG